jgi:hypothetical protein
MTRLTACLERREIRRSMASAWSCVIVMPGVTAGSVPRPVWPTPMVNTPTLSLNLVNGTTHRFSGPSQRSQCAEAVFRMFVIPLWGSVPSSAGQSTGLTLALSFSARRFVASNSACLNDGMPQHASTSSRPSGALRDRHRMVREYPGHRRQSFSSFSMCRATRRSSAFATVRLGDA